ncbi:hypothetical protein QVH36_05190 [Corynebacterium rouxii]
MVATAVMMAFTLITPISELLAWMGKRGLPEGLNYVIALMYRMITTLM